MRNPKLRQAAITISDGSAQRVLPASPARRCRPSRAPLFTRPTSGCSRNRHTTAIATMLVTTGR